MAKVPPADKRLFRTVPVGALVPGITRPAFRAHGPALGQLLADWPLIVGPSLAQATTPRRLAAGTLTLGCAGPMALELQHLAGPLCERINTHYGQALVKRLGFVHQPPATRPAAPPRPAPKPVPIEGVADGPLRDALGALGGALQQRSGKSTRT